jgi:hypothetical protein
MITGETIRLAPAPRAVPFPVVCALLFGGIWQFTWVVCAAFMFGLGAATLDQVQQAEEKGYIRHAVTAQGRITAVYEEQSSHAAIQFYDFDYAFRTKDGREMTGHGFTGDEKPVVGSVVTVTYSADDPLMTKVQLPSSRKSQRIDITVLTQRIASLWPLGLLTLIGLIPLTGINLGRRRLRLLARGRLAEGWVISDIYVSGKSSYYLVTVAFLGEDGRLYSICERANSVEEWIGEGESDSVAVLYDPKAPTQGTALRNSAEAEAFRIDNAGRIQAKSSASLGLLVLPAVVAAGFVYIVWQVTLAFLH